MSRIATSTRWAQPSGTGGAFRALPGGDNNSFKLWHTVEEVLETVVAQLDRGGGTLVVCWDCIVPLSDRFKFIKGVFHDDSLRSFRTRKVSTRVKADRPPSRNYYGIEYGTAKLKNGNHNERALADK